MAKVRTQTDPLEQLCVNAILLVRTAWLLSGFSSEAPDKFEPECIANFMEQFRAMHSHRGPEWTQLAAENFPPAEHFDRVENSYVEIAYEIGFELYCILLEVQAVSR